MLTGMIIVFLVGYLFIALEHPFKINKAGTALLTGTILWVMYTVAAPSFIPTASAEEFKTFLENFPAFAPLPFIEQSRHFVVDHQVLDSIGEISETLIFLIGAMITVELIDAHGGFMFITNRITTTEKKKLLLLVATITFFMSAVLDNLTTSIVMIMLIRKLLGNYKERWVFGSIIVIAANSGGAWSPIGDVTTILLWVGKNITAMHQIGHVFLPALVNMLVPLTIAHFWLFKKGAKLRVMSEEEQADEYIPEIPNRSRRIIFVIGVLSLALVPVFQMLTNLPPFMGVLLGLIILWIYTDIMYSRSHLHESQKLRISQLLPNIDLATIFFFLGILMSVGALETSGQLGIMSAFLDKHVHEPYLISFVIGVLSSCVDNVALVAATMGMYPIAEQTAHLSQYAQFFVSDGGFWTFLAYCAVTGGSILIIGSATGVTVMGLEKIDFMYYTKRFSILALVGYCCGAGLYMLLFA